MSPDEFYTDKGEWLTLKQLRERDAQVFQKSRDLNKSFITTGYLRVAFYCCDPDGEQRNCRKT